MIEDEAPGMEALPLEDRLGEAALAAVMGDPYEVGLRIALDDGVAAALPAVTRELAVLDRAVGVVRTGLAGLAGWAPAAVVPPLPEAGAPGGEAAPEPARAQASPADTVPMSRGVAPVLRETPFGGVLRAAERAAAEVMPAASPVAVPAPAVASRPAVGKPEALDWGGMDWPAIAAVPGVAPAAPAASAVAPEVEAPAAAAPVPSWPGVQGALGPAPSAAPPALPPALLAPPDFAEPAAQAAPRDDGAEDAAEERAMQGVLEIDGALLGRFVAEHLAREAGRPPAGMTGFDPLLSPQWAGALQG